MAGDGKNPPFMELLGPGTVIADLLKELPPSTNREMTRTRMGMALGQAIRLGDPPVFAIVGRANSILQIPRVLLTTSCRLPEDEATNDGRSRYPVSVDPLRGWATLDPKAANLILRERPDLVPDADRVRPPPPGVQRPTPDDQISRFVRAIDEEVWVPTGRRDFPVKVPVEQAKSVLVPVMQELPRGRAAKASDEQIRAKLEKLKADSAATGQQPGDQNARRDWVANALRLEGLTIDRAAFVRQDRRIFNTPAGRPPKAKRTS